MATDAAEGLNALGFTGMTQFCFAQNAVVLFNLTLLSLFNFDIYLYV